MHAPQWFSVATSTADECKANKHLMTRDAACRFCNKRVYGVERHSLQCPVLFQASVRKCLAQAPSEAADRWKGLASLTVESCTQYLEGARSVEQSLAEPLNRFCVICAQQGVETPLMDMQAWRRHLQLRHGVDKFVLTTTHGEHAAVAHMVRPCTYCLLPFHKSPKLHRSKCLPLAQLLSLRHGYDGIGGDTDRGSGKRNEGQTSQVQKAGQRRRQGTAERQEASGAYGGGRRGATGNSHAVRDPHHPHTADSSRPSAESAGGGSNLRSFLFNNRDGHPGHVEDRDQPLEGPIREGDLHNHTQGGSAHEFVDGNGGEAREVRARSSSHQDHEGRRALPGGPESLGLHNVEPAGEEGAGDGPTAPVFGGAQGSAQDPQGGSHDGWGHPSLCADAEARAERDGADRSIHPGAHHESQGRTSARRDGQAGELSSAVTDRTTPAGGKAAAEPVSQGAGKVTGLGSTGSPHCRRPTTPQAGNACQTMSMDGGAGAQSQWKQDAITHRLRYPHGRDTEKQRGDERGVASHQGSSALDGADIVGDGDLYRGATHTMSSDSNGAQRAKTADRVTDAAASTSSRKDGTQSQTTIPWQVRHPGVVASSVPPNYCLRNRSNYCYLNAVAVAVHWAVISSGSTPRDLGSFGPAIDVLNRLKQVELPGHATWKALLQGWRRPTQQHDVTELMSFVMDPRSRLVVGEWQARCIEPGHDTICDRGLTSPFISFAIRGHTTLQDALTAWHEQHYRHALCAPPKLLAIQLGRFCSVGRRTVKVRTPCVIPLEIAIPCFCDDLLECGPQLYRLCSGIVHIGDMATTGHYRPFCVHRVVHRPGYEATSPVGSGAMLGSYTLYDDDRPPVLNTAATDNLLRHNAYVVFYIRI